MSLRYFATTGFDAGKLKPKYFFKKIIPFTKIQNVHPKNIHFFKRGRSAKHPLFLSHNLILCYRVTQPLLTSSNLSCWSHTISLRVMKPLLKSRNLSSSHATSPEVTQTTSSHATSHQVTQPTSPTNINNTVADVFLLFLILSSCPFQIFSFYK